MSGWTRSWRWSGQAARSGPLYRAGLQSSFVRPCPRPRASKPSRLLSPFKSWPRRSGSENSPYAWPPASRRSRPWTSSCARWCGCAKRPMPAKVIPMGCASACATAPRLNRRPCRAPAARRNHRARPIRNRARHRDHPTRRSLRVNRVCRPRRAARLPTLPARPRRGSRRGAPRSRTRRAPRTRPILPGSRTSRIRPIPPAALARRREVEGAAETSLRSSNVARAQYDQLTTRKERESEK